VTWAEEPLILRFPVDFAAQMGQILDRAIKSSTDPLAVSRVTEIVWPFGAEYRIEAPCAMSVSDESVFTRAFTSLMYFGDLA
jgi:hypothetical protein